MNDEQLEKILSGFREKRYFRAIMFSSPDIKNLSQAAKLVGGIDSKPLKWKKTSGIFTDIDGVRLKFNSDRFYLRSGNPTVREAFQASRRTDTFSYEVDVLRYRMNDEALFLVAAPFSGLAIELIKNIEEKKGSADFRYLKPSLKMLYQYLVEDRSKGGVTTAAINWYVSGEENFLNQITLRGTNIAQSKVFDELVKGEKLFNLEGVRFSVRRIQVLAENIFADSGGLKVTFDRSGQAAIWVTQDALNLREFFGLFKILQNAKVMEQSVSAPFASTEEVGLMGS